MICRECKAAGDLRKAGPGYSKQARAKHKLCEFPKSCTCQHYIGEGTIRREDAKEN